MLHLKEITEHAWLVQGPDNKNVGLLSEFADKLTFVIHNEGDTEQPSNKVRFENREDVMNALGNDIFDTKIVVVETAKEHFVNSYPVEFHNPHEITKEGCDLPLYSKTLKGGIAHCAGYYVIHFNKGPIYSYCPKLETLEKYTYDGPFKTEMEMKVVLSQAKKRLKSKY